MKKKAILLKLSLETHLYLLFNKSLTLYNSADVFHQDCEDGMVWSDLYNILIHVAPGQSWLLTKKETT